MSISIAKLCSSLIFILFLKIGNCQLGSDNKQGSEFNSNTIQQALQRKFLDSNPTWFSDKNKPLNGKFHLPQGGNLQSCAQPQIEKPAFQNFQQSLNCKGHPSLPSNFPIQNNGNNFLQSTQTKQQMNPQFAVQRSQQRPSLQNVDLSFTSMPIVNGEVSGLPSQVSQGTLLSNLGLTSLLPSLISNAFAFDKKSEQPYLSLQNNIIPNNGLPQFSNLNVVPNGYSNVFSNGVPNNNPPASIVIPMSSFASQTSSPSVENDGTSQGDFTLKSIHLTPLPQEFSQHSGFVQNKQAELGTFGASQKMVSPFINKMNYPNSQEPNSKKKGKKSSFKNLLPLLLNLLQDDGGNSCGCPLNFNNHAYPMPPVSSNCSQNIDLPLEVSSEYSNMINCGKNDVQKEENKQETNDDGISEEMESAEVSRRRRNKYCNRKHRRKYHECDDEYSDEEDD